MERRVMGNCHARCEAREKREITSNSYLSLLLGKHRLLPSMPISTIRTTKLFCGHPLTLVRHSSQDMSLLHGCLTFQRRMSRIRVSQSKLFDIGSRPTPSGS